MSHLKWGKRWFGVISLFNDDLAEKSYHLQSTLQVENVAGNKLEGEKERERERERKEWERVCDWERVVASVINSTVGWIF